MSNLNRPEYRVRLFLSVDLTGSTQFKSNADNTSHDWLKAFQKFYGEFPGLFSTKYAKTCDAIPDISKSEKESTPKVWKTIGDEILFVNRVNSITHLAAYISSFVEALKEFGHEIYPLHNLNTKGNAWVAAFPSPNCAISLSFEGGDPLSGTQDILTEEFEAEVDENPRNFDFLGKGIDGGFRIARNSTIDALTVSPALAFLLCSAKKNSDTTKFECEFQFHEPQALKGMVNGNPYPVISIDTNRDPLQKEIHALQAKLRRSPESADFLLLSSYLEKYITYHKIEMPILKLSDSSAPVNYPENYTDYIKQWDSEWEKLKQQEELEVEAGNQLNDDGSDDNHGIDDARKALISRLKKTEAKLLGD